MKTKLITKICCCLTFSLLLSFPAAAASARNTPGNTKVSNEATLLPASAAENVDADFSVQDTNAGNRTSAINTLDANEDRTTSTTNTPDANKDRSISDTDISEATTAPTPGLYELCSALDTGFVLDLKTCTYSETEASASDNSESSSILQMYRSLDVNQQKFYLEQLPGSCYRLSSVSSGDAITAVPDAASDSNSSDASESASGDADDTFSGASVCMSELLRSAGTAADVAQSWIPESCGDGYYYLKCKQGGYLTLDTTADTAAIYNGAPLVLTGFTGEANQKWSFRKTWISKEASADTDLVNPYGEYGPYQGLRISMWFGRSKETLTSEELASWITETEEHQLLMDEEAFTAFVETLAEKYDTQGQPRNFRTSYGNEITLYEGNFGWKLNVEETAQLLLDEIKSNTPHFIQPVWSHKGKSFTDGSDIGDSYVEVDLINQKVWLYKDGELLLETECVSGTCGTDRQTPGGVYSIFYMQSPAVLRGANYASPVDYWMAFNGGIGLHDANWRSEFGGDIFRTNGSHGCINLPTEAAKLIYETVEIGYPVVCYN